MLSLLLDLLGKRLIILCLRRKQRGVNSDQFPRRQTLRWSLGYRMFTELCSGDQHLEKTGDRSGRGRGKEELPCGSVMGLLTPLGALGLRDPSVLH